MKTIGDCRSGATASPTSWRAPTPGIDTLERHEFVAGRATLIRKIRRYRPRIVAMVGVTVFRAMFPGSPGAGHARSAGSDARGRSWSFVLPNPSGRNANFSFAEMLAAYSDLRLLIRDL